MEFSAAGELSVALGLLYIKEPIVSVLR